MKKVWGIVLEVNKKHLVLLTPDGDYLKVPHPGGNVRRGDEVSCRPAVPGRPKAFTAAAFLAAAALVLIAIFPLGIPDSGLLETGDAADPVQGYLVFDINPSFELVYNQDLEVTAMQPLNEDAVLLLQDLELNGQLYDTLEWLLERSVSMGYLDSDQEQNFIFITLIQPGEVEVVPGLLADFIEENLSHLGISGSVGVFETGEQEYEEAASAGISVNRYLLLEALQQQVGDEESLDDKSLGELLHKLDGKDIANLVITTFRPEQLPPQVPDEPGRPDDTERKDGDQPDLPELPQQVPSGNDDGSGSPASIPVFSD